MESLPTVQALTPHAAPQPSIDIEKVRLPCERDFASQLQRHPALAHLPELDGAPEPSTIRRVLLGRALRLSQTMAPELHRTCQAAMNTLGVRRPYEIYQADGDQNASIYLVQEPVLLMVEGRLISLLDSSTMLCVLGHELGHYLAHGPWTPAGQASRLASLVVEAKGVSEELASLASAACMAKELTADRFGLLACQDLDTALRLEMMLTTGLPAQALTWDTGAYLAQCREIIEKCLADGGSVLGSTHPEHNLRGYALWLFSESDLYKQLTGKGSGARPIQEVDAILARLLQTPGLDTSYRNNEAIPPEVHVFALAACVLVAWADEDIADSEAAAIEKVFAPLVEDYRRYFDRAVANQVFSESASLVASAGADVHKSLFLLLTHVLGADGVIHPNEVSAILSIGKAIGCEALYRQLMGSVLRHFQLSPQLADASLQPGSIPLPPRDGEARSALDTFMRGLARRGGGEVRLRRLLRLLGSKSRTAEHLSAIDQSIRTAGLRCDTNLESIDLDAPIELRLERPIQPQAVASPAPRPSDEPTIKRLMRGLARLREQLISGDGRSPSVRMYQTRQGRSFDLYALEQVSVGLAERVLVQIREGHRARLVEASEAGQQGAAKGAVQELLALYRENASRFEESGAKELALGYPFICGTVGGYLVRGPLVLIPCELERDERGARGFTLVPLKDEGPQLNGALLRLMFAKKGYALTDELYEQLEQTLQDSSKELDGLLSSLASIGLILNREPQSLGALADRREEAEKWGPEHLVLEESAVLGLFPQSSSDLLQDYDGLLGDLAQSQKPAGAILGLAASLLPAEVEQAIAPSEQPPEPPKPPVPIVPVIQADPSQLQVLAMARTHKALVVDGPPGTGKSQVIVNLVADALAQGKRVAVVSEKRAALDVVAQRLQQTGLDDSLALVHDLIEDRKPLYSKIASRLETTASAPFNEAACASTSNEISQLGQLLSARLQALAERPDEQSSLTFGNLHALAASSEGAKIALADPIGLISENHLERLRTDVASLSSFADLANPELPWRMQRPYLASVDASFLNAIDQMLAQANATAQRFEQAWTAIGRQPIERLEAARAGLELAQSTRDLRSQPQDQALFGNVLAAAQSAPERLQLVPQAMEAWKAAHQTLGQSPRRQVVFDPGPQVEASIGVLLSWTGKFFRFFAPSWWRARKAVREGLIRAWPEQAAASFDPPFLHELLAIIRATRAWGMAQSCLQALSLQAFAGAGFEQVGALLHKLGTIASRISPLLAHRAMLLPLGAWPQALTPEHLAAWDRSIDAFLGVIAAKHAHSNACQPLRQHFPWLSPFAEHEALESLHALWRRDALRLSTLDTRLGTLSNLTRDARGLFHGFADRLAGAPSTSWAEAAIKTWTEDRIQSLQSRNPAVMVLDQPTPLGPEPAAAEHFAKLLSQQTELERSRLKGKLSGLELIQSPEPEKGARRTAVQATRQALLKETRKQRSLMPLRTFVRKFASEGLLDLMPVWLMSPETVSVLFPREPLFDIVIFDEASQCTVESGLPVLIRAKHAVIAGDEKQMPPSSFFTAKGVEEDSEGPEEESESDELFASESLLALARARLPHIGLQWHYRCQYEELIAFSNHAMYGGDLRTIPSTKSRAAAPALRWVSVQGGKNESGRNEPEAERVVDELQALLQQSPARTLGVVTFNIQQRQCILDAIDKRRASDKGFAEAWAKASSAERLDERPFVRNLENVQGDERDVIIFSPSYAPLERVTQRGTEKVLPARFGPLGQRGGERRLNVAISRAKHACIIVASFEPGMLSAAKTKHDGPKLFKYFLEFAYHLAQGQHVLADRVLETIRQGRAASNKTAQGAKPTTYVPVKAQIALALQEKGIPSELEVGTSEFRVPLAVGSPSEPGHYRVAVLCDEGDKPATAFETFVHVPAVLRTRGWTVLRVSARDWYRDKAAVLKGIASQLGSEAGTVPEARSKPMYAPDHA